MCTWISLLGKYDNCRIIPNKYRNVIGMGIMKKLWTIIEGYSLWLWYTISGE